jgi:hypothetical protein
LDKNSQRFYSCFPEHFGATSLSDFSWALLRPNSVHGYWVFGECRDKRLPTSHYDNFFPEKPVISSKLRAS